MGRVTELRVRNDWQVVRFIYLPAVAVGLTPFNPCALCVFCWWWGHHLEEWVSRKNLFHITDSGLHYEDGGKPMHFGWSDIEAISLHRRTGSPPLWRTDGDIKTGKPPFWLSITVRGPTQQAGDQSRTICVWPRQVKGGLFSLMRFARELQAQLIERADRGEIRRLLPGGSR
jgi:hypothetical protein